MSGWCVGLLQRAKAPRVDVNPELASNVRAVLGEGPSWDADRNVLYWVDIAGGVIYAHSPGSPDDRVVQMVKEVSVVVPRRSGGLGVIAWNRIYGLDLKSKALTPITEEVESDKGTRFNDGKCDSAGRLWTGTMDVQQRDPTGSLYVLERNLTLRKLLSGVAVSNGMGWSPDNKKMYYIDSPTKMVSVFDYNLQTGEVANRRTAVDFTQTQQPGIPDGMAVDEEGMIWVTHWGGARLTRWDPSNGSLLETIMIPSDQVTSCCFGGRNLDELYITSARFKQDPKVVASQPLSGRLFVTKVGVKGLPTNSFDG